MTCETILHEDEGALGWLTLDSPDDGEMLMRRRRHEVRDRVDEVGRDTRTSVPMDAGASSFLCPRRRIDLCVVTPVGERLSVPALRGEACRFDHSRRGSALGEPRP